MDDHKNQLEFLNRLAQVLTQQMAKEEQQREIALLIQQYQIDVQTLLGTLTEVRHTLDATLQNYGQSLLTQAFKQQDFDAAHQLIMDGHTIGSEERAAFEIALESDNAIDFGFPDSLTKPLTQGKPLHTVKKFGLFLGVKMTSEDGTSSQMGHVGQTLGLMTESVNQYATAHSSDSNIQSIAQAFSFADRTAQYRNSRSQNPNAGQQLAERIKQGKTTVIPMNFKGHAMGCSVVPDKTGKGGFISITNRGIGASPSEHGTKVYRVEDLSKVDAKFINAAMNGCAQSTSAQEMQRNINNVIGNNAIPVAEIPQSSQRIDNCTICNPRSNIQGMMLAMKAVEKGGMENVTQEDYDETQNQYQSFTQEMKLNQVHELAQQIKANPDNLDYKNLAQNYIEQHNEADPVLVEVLTVALEKNNKGEELNRDNQISIGLTH